MKPSDIDLMTVSETLTQAKHHLWDGRNIEDVRYVSGSRYKNEYICHALDRVAHLEDKMNAVSFLVSYGMSTGGIWFDRVSDHWLGTRSKEITVQRQLRRKTFLEVAIRHATKLGI